MQTTTKKKLKLSPRTKVRLTQEEWDQLKEYVAFDTGAAYANIKANSGLHRDTVDATIERGFLELKPALKLRDFLKELKKQNI